MKRRLLWILVLIGCLSPGVASADVPPATPYYLTGTTAVTIKAGPGIFFGATSAGIQTNALTCDDALSITGTPLFTGILGSAGASVSGIPPGGVRFATGLTCQVPTAIVTSVTIFYY